MPECFRLARRIAAEARSPSASPAQCAGYDGSVSGIQAAEWARVGRRGSGFPLCRTQAPQEPGGTHERNTREWRQPWSA